MNGIRTGTREEQLTDLRRQIRVQLEIARVHNAGDVARLEDLATKVDAALGIEAAKNPPADFEKFPKPHGPNVVDQILHELGVTTHDVRVWAIEAGLLDGVHRGRISRAIVECYATHRRLADLLGEVSQ